MQGDPHAVQISVDGSCYPSDGMKAGNAGVVVYPGDDTEHQVAFQGFEESTYYTPKPIVSFMCREALKGYLETSAASESKGAIERFVERHESNDLRNAEAVLDVLRRVKVCERRL